MGTVFISPYSLQISQDTNIKILLYPRIVSPTQTTSLVEQAEDSEMTQAGGPVQGSLEGTVNVSPSSYSHFQEPVFLVQFWEDN